MRNSFNFETEPFEAYSEFDEGMELFDGYEEGASGLYPELEEEFSFSIFPESVLKALRSGLESVAVQLAIAFGFRDENTLTNLVFFTRHPGRIGKPIERHEKQLAREWLDIRDRLVRPALARVLSAVHPSVSPMPPAAAMSEDDKLFKYHPPTDRRKYGGYSRYGGGRVDKVLKELRKSERLPISDADIDMLQRIANVELGGQIQGINSYDSAFMSMGFMQWTITYGKLQRLIQQAPAAFRRYGIELDFPRRYSIQTPYGIETPIAIKGAQNPSDLRSLDWAKRFYAAGLDPEIIIEEVKFALKIIEESKGKIVNKVGREFLPYYEKSPVLRALIQATFNNRPAYLYIALKRATMRAKSMGSISTDQFLELVRKAIKEVYREKEPEKGSKKAENLIRKTATL